MITTMEADGGQVVLRLTGELDFTTSEQVSTAVDEVLTGAVDRLTVDLGGVTFCDSSGIHAIMAAHDRVAARDGSLVVTHARGPVERVLKVCGVWDTLTVS